MILFKFRMLSDENDHFVRDYEVPSEMTLLELHDFIIESLEYEPCIASFYTADEKWERLAEFTAEDMGLNPLGESEIPALPMDSVKLSEVLTHMHDRLIYLFDMFGNRAYYMELVEASQVADGGNYPRESFAHATPPDQYDPSENVEDSSIFEEMMGDFGEYDDDGDDEW
ncbi:MAG: hypothetical protein SNG79_05150 [Rikenellaceae bacterium]